MYHVSHEWQSNTHIYRVSYEWQFIYRLHTTDDIRRQKSKVTILHIFNTQLAFHIVFGDGSKKKSYIIYTVFMLDIIHRIWSFQTNSIGQWIGFLYQVQMFILVWWWFVHTLTQFVILAKVKLVGLQWSRNCSCIDSESKTYSIFFQVCVMLRSKSGNVRIT